MANLFWKQGKKTFNLLSKPFETEEMFEKEIFETQELFEDLTFLKRQATHGPGSGSGRPDILAIDSDGNICIIEMKNTPVDEKIFTQVLNYAIWAESNPDSLKNLWYELEDKPEIDWDNFEVRIMVIASEIHQSTLKFVNSINYSLDLIEIKRWATKTDSFLLVNELKPRVAKKSKTIKGLENYDKKYYLSRHKPESVKNFLHFVKEAEKLLKKQGWKNIEKKFNKHYCGFKYGFFNLFTIAWIGSKSFAFRIRMPEKELKKITPGLKLTKYSRKQGYYNVDPGKTKISSFLPLIRASMKNKTIG